MLKLKPILAVLLCLAMCLPFGVLAAGLPGTVCVTDYVAADTGEDVADALQALIDANPNRTIWFPDGEYLVSHPLCTPADPAKSVDLQLANYAVIRATEDFTGGAVIALGGKDPYNTSALIGSNYSLTGGVIDGSDIADGVSIDSGRETRVQNTSIKNTVVGLHVKYGANSGSSDADIRDVNITGNSAADSVGILVEGYDNTFTNVRIGFVRTGVVMRSGGNALTNVHPLFEIAWDLYEGSCGFREESGSNVYTYCYSDQFQTAFRIVGNGRSIYDNCYAYWWSGKGGNCTGFRSDGSNFNAVVTNLRVDFRKDTDNTMYSGPLTGSGVFARLMVKEERLNANRSYLTFVEQAVIVHTLNYVPETPATVASEGNVAYYRCATCGKNFADPDGTQELADVTVPRLPEPETEPDPGPGPQPDPGPEETQSNCVCGKHHSGPFAFILIFFHRIVYFFKNLF